MLLIFYIYAAMDAFTLNGAAKAAKRTKNQQCRPRKNYRAIHVRRTKKHPVTCCHIIVYL